MGETPRTHVTQIPLPTRSTEASSECEGRTYLTYLREEDVRPASFFILGDVLHRTIEWAIRFGADLNRAKLHMTGLMGAELAKVKGKVVIEGMQRNMESIMEDADRMITNWFAHVHPDSDKRHPFYDQFQWPPVTEYKFHSTRRGTRFPVWGSVDAVFEAKSKRLNDTGKGLAIVDWKSGVKRPEGQFQLDYYRFGTGWHEAQAAYHMLDRIRKPSIVVEAEPYPGDTYIKEAISRTERTKQGVVAGRMPTFKPGWYCPYCPVQHICPEDGDPRKRGRNERDLRRMLKKAVPLTILPKGTTDDRS